MALDRITKILISGQNLAKNNSFPSHFSQDGTTFLALAPD